MNNLYSDSCQTNSIIDLILAKARVSSTQGMPLCDEVDFQPCLLFPVYIVQNAYGMRLDCFADR